MGINIGKAQFCAFFLAVVILRHLYNAQADMDLSDKRAVAASWTPFELIPFQHLSPVGPPKRVKERFPIWRLSTPVHNDVLVRGGGTQFIVIVEFPPVSGTRIGHFVARVRSLLTAERAWYTEGRGDRPRRVHAALQLPVTTPNANRPKPAIVIDVECDGCDMKKVSLTYEDKRPDFFTVENRREFLDFFSRERQTTAPGVIFKSVDNSGPNGSVRRWEFVVMSDTLCATAFDGRMFVVADSRGKKIKFSWKLGSTRYPASTSQNGPSYLVQWLPKDSSLFCNDQTPQITLIATCEGCNVYERLTKAEIPKEPEVPRGADSVPVALFRGSWQENGTCRLDGLNWAAIGRIIGDVFTPRLWFDSSVPCQRRANEPRNASFFSDLHWQEKRTIVSNWQKDLSTRYMTERNGLLFSGGSQCLCHQLKGRLYRFVSWDSRGVAMVQANANMDNALIGESGFESRFHHSVFSTVPISRKRRHINKASVDETPLSDSKANEDGINGAAPVPFAVEEKKSVDDTPSPTAQKKGSREVDVAPGNGQRKAQETSIWLPITTNEDNTKSEAGPVAFKEQRIVLYRDEDASSQSWTGTVDISAREIQCAKSNIVVMLVFDGEGERWDLTFLNSSIGRLGAHYVYKRMHTVEVSIISQALSQQNQCVIRPNATLTLRLDWAGSTSVRSVATFSFGRPFKEVEPQVLTAVAFVNKTSLKPREFMIWRFTTPVHPDVLARGAGTPFTAVIQFSPITNSRITHFVPRPQTLLDEVDAWYTQKLNNGGNKVYVTLRLPLTTGRNERYEQPTPSSPPKIVIDVACVGCDPQKAFVAYGPPYLGWPSVKERKVYETVLQRCPTTGPLTPSQRMPDSMCEPNMRCFTFNTTVNNVCGNLFKGGLFFTVFPPASKTDFYWQLIDDSRKRYKPSVGVNGPGRLVLLGSANDDHHLCKERRKSNILLHMTCKQCSIHSFYGLIHPTLPEVPFSNSSGLVVPYARLAKPTWGEDGTCHVNTSNNITASVGDIPRLWLSFKVPCVLQLKRANGTPSTSGELLRHWESEITDHLITKGGWSFTGVPQCFCEALTGRLYRAVYWETAAVAQSTNYITDIAMQYHREYFETQNQKELCGTARDLYENRDYDDDDYYDDGDSEDSENSDDDNYEDDDDDYEADEDSEDNDDDDDDEYYYTSDDDPPKEIIPTAARNFGRATGQSEKAKKPHDLHLPTRFNEDELLVEATILNTKVSQYISLLVEMTPNTVRGLKDRDRMVFHYWMTKKQMKSPVPFVVTFCFVCLINDTSTVEFVLSEERVKVLEPRTASDSPLQCYTIDACETWNLLSHPNVLTTSILPRITVTGKCAPDELRWGMDVAVKLKDTARKEKHTTVSRAGWYGTAEERSKYTSTSDIVEIKVQNSSLPFCVPVATASGLSHGGENATETTGSSPQSPALSATQSSFVYLQPPFEIDLTKILSYNADRSRFMANALILAVILATLQLKGQHFFSIL